MMKLFSRSRSTSFSIRTWEGSRSFGSFAGRIVSDWKKAAWSLRAEAEESKGSDSALLSRRICTKRKKEKQQEQWMKKNIAFKLCPQKNTSLKRETIWSH